MTTSDFPRGDQSVLPSCQVIWPMWMPRWGNGGFDIWAARWYWLYYNVIYVYNIDQQQHIGYYITTPHYYIETLYIYDFSVTTHIMIYAYDVHHFCSSKPTMKWYEPWLICGSLQRSKLKSCVCVVIPYTPHFFGHMVILINLHNNLHVFDDFEIYHNYDYLVYDWTIRPPPSFPWTREAKGLKINKLSGTECLGEDQSVRYA